VDGGADGFGELHLVLVAGLGERGEGLLRVNSAGQPMSEQGRLSPAIAEKLPGFVVSRSRPNADFLAFTFWAVTQETQVGHETAARGARVGHRLSHGLGH
jgi:hypothetical protein